MEDLVDKMDKRNIRATGNYASRAELVAAIRQRRNKGMSFEQIGRIVGVATATVTRIYRGDEPAYKPKEPVVREDTPQSRLDKLWKVPNA